MDEQLAQRLRFCQHLPSLPAVALRIIELANEPHTSMAQIAEQVSYDPALCAKLLRVSNSPLYNLARKPENLRQALSLLGTHATLTIALSFSLVNALRGQGAGALPESNAYWRRAILSALASRLLAQKLAYAPSDDFFLSALLQDVGVLALCCALGDEYHALRASARDHDELIRAERAAFGAGHDEVGHWLLQRWNLPRSLCLAVFHSHEPERAWESRPLAACGAIAGRLADLCSGVPSPEAAALAAGEAQRLLGLDGGALAEVLAELRGALPEVEGLFEVTLRPDEAAALIDEARELLVVRDLAKVRELEEQSRRDPLTGIFNRGYFDDALRREFDLATRRGWPLSVALLDLDRFKAVNDNYGHPAGDAVLVAVGRAVSAELRQSDIFARYGGEEFAIVLPGTHLEAAEQLASRLREAVGRLGHTLPDRATIHITASIGIAAHLAGGTRYAHADALLEAADRALYAAKHGGRNRVVAVAEDRSPPAC